MYVAGQIPFNLLLLRTFLAGIPRELEEAGKIDGCSEMGVFVRITLPIAKPIFLTVALLVFVHVWNEFLWANTFLVNDNLKTVATRYVRFVGEYSSNMAYIYTASVLTICAGHRAVPDLQPAVHRGHDQRKCEGLIKEGDLT